MSLTSQIDRVYTLVAQKINDLRNRLDMLEHADTIKDHLVSIGDELDKLGCCTPKYCLPDLCAGELPEFPVPPIEELAPREFPEIPDIPLPPKAPPPVFPEIPEDPEDPEIPEDPVDIIGSVVVEGMYIESYDLGLLPLSYRNIAVGFVHICNNAKFAVYANDVYIGDINLNNDTLGQSLPYDNQSNTPSVLTGGTWTGSPNARYSRIDITTQQASQIVANSNSTVLQFKLIGLSSNPHSDITWLRISRNVGSQLQVVQDVLAQLGQEYPVDVAG